jgi:hypothetical protein
MICLLHKLRDYVVPFYKRTLLYYSSLDSGFSLLAGTFPLHLVPEPFPCHRYSYSRLTHWRHHHSSATSHSQTLHFDSTDDSYLRTELYCYSLSLSHMRSQNGLHRKHIPLMFRTVIIYQRSLFSEGLLSSGGYIDFFSWSLPIILCIRKNIIGIWGSRSDEYKKICLLGWKVLLDN